jgi:hypothetical protein
MRIMRLLSALEGVMMAEGRRIPDYLHDELGELVKALEQEILGRAQQEGRTDAPL